MNAAKNRTEIKGAGGEIILYRTKDGRTAVDVRLEKETVWLTQKNIAVLFTTERSVITRHLNNIFQSGELQRESNVQKMHIPGSDKPVAFYNLDAVLSVGYRVNSRRGTEFRIWATQVLKDHILKGYTLNEQRLKAQGARLNFGAKINGKLYLTRINTMLAYRQQTRQASVLRDMLKFGGFLLFRQERPA